MQPDRSSEDIERFNPQIEEFRLENTIKSRRITESKNQRSLSSLFLGYSYLCVDRCLTDGIVRKVRKDRRKTERHDDVAIDLLYCNSEEREKPRRIRLQLYIAVYLRKSIFASRSGSFDRKVPATCAKIKQPCSKSRFPPYQTTNTVISIRDVCFARSAYQMHI